MVEVVPQTPKVAWVGEVWGGLAAMLVALPSAIAYAVVAFGPLGSAATALAATAGMLGTVAIGIVAPVFGGTQRLVSAPCAPAAAVLATFAAHLATTQGEALTPERAAALIGIVGLMAGLMQLGFSAIGGGRLIKYIPYPVVAGYLSGVGVLIFVGQLPKLLGSAHGHSIWGTLAAPTTWSAASLIVGVVSIAAMLGAPRLTHRVPAPIVALVAGVVVYLGLGFAYDATLLSIDGNPLVIGRLGARAGEAEVGFTATLVGRWGTALAFSPRDLAPLMWPALTLAVLLSIDTLKTCVVLDAMTRTRHDSNRELRGQGLGNTVAALVGGMPGAGTMGATLINLNSGGKTRLSSVLMGVFALAALALLGPLVAWVPVASLAGILMVVAVRMFDTHALALLSHRSTRLDFAVIVAVVVTAVGLSLIAASVVGVAFAIFLFLRAQIATSVVRRRVAGNLHFSKKRRIPTEMKILEQKGHENAGFELQGSLFFGTTDQLFTELEDDLKTKKRIILDLRRIVSVDFTAARMLEQIAAQLADHGGTLVFAGLPVARPSGQDLERYFKSVGLTTGNKNIRVFDTLDDAHAWCEDDLLRIETEGRRHFEQALALDALDMFAGISVEALEALRGVARERKLAKGDMVFRQGDRSDELYLIRRGLVRIQIDLGAGRTLHVATFGQGDFFGDMAFLDHDARSADAVARTEVELYTLSRHEFDTAVLRVPALGQVVFSRLAKGLALRLRMADRELRTLAEA